MREEVALSVMVDGQAHVGLYAVESEMMTAWIPSVGSRTCWLEGRDPGKVARLLLQEVIRECRRKHAVAVLRPARRSSDYDEWKPRSPRASADETRARAGRVAELPPVLSG